jgi:hypothetical protein
VIPRVEVYCAIDAERLRQQEKWNRIHTHGKGDCSSADVPEPIKAAVLGEETGEVCRALLDGDREGLRRELVQVAAVAVAWLEGLG